jgi:hypothetical protein
LKKTRLEDGLLTGLKASIQGDVIPKNPWCEVSRYLGTQNLKTDIYEKFAVLRKNWKPRQPTAYGPYKICSITFNYKEL